MLEMSIISGDDPDDNLQYAIRVSATSSGAVGSYEGCFYPSSPDSQADEMMLHNYPRWSEDAGALCTRFLAMALELDPEVKLKHPLENFGIVVEIVPHGRYSRARLLEAYNVSLEGDTWHVSSKEAAWEVRGVNENSGVCAVALHVLKVIYWDGGPIPEPKPFEVRVHEEPSYGYVLMSEIPEPAQAAFRKSMAHSGRPPYPRDAAYSYDWLDFLAGSR